MSTPFLKPGYSSYPEKTLVRHFRNSFLQLKKTIQSSKNIEELNLQMEHFINTNRQITWPHHTSDVFHKDEAEKAVEKVVTEFRRYIKDLQGHTLKKAIKTL